jgi:ABC-type transport system involved in multi-copper enzyme maturation permease subunit
MKLLAMLRKEMRITLRRPWFVIQLAVLLTSLALGIWSNWGRYAVPVSSYVISPSVRSSNIMISPIYRPSPAPAGLEQRAVIGRSLFLLMGYIQIVCFSLIAAILTATAITREREARTYETLIASGMHTWHILGGKLSAMLASLAVMSICMLPMLALVFQFGGVGSSEYLTYSGVIILLMMTYGMIGLAVSCLVRRSLSALFLALGLVLALLLGPVVSIYLIFPPGWLGSGRSGFFNWSPGLFARDPWTSLILCLSPLVAANNPILGFRNIFSNGILVHIIYQCALFGLALILARWGLRRRETVRPAVATRLIDDPAILRRRREKWPYYLIDPMARPQSIGDRQNPFEIKERRGGLFSKPQVLIRVGYLVMAASLFLLPLMNYLFSQPYNYYRVHALDIFDLAPQEFTQRLAATLLTLAILFIPLLAATLVSREREEGTFELLVSSPARPRRIILGKFWAVYRLVLLLGLSFILLPILFYILYQILSLNRHMGGISAKYLLGPSTWIFLKTFSGWTLVTIPYLMAMLAFWTSVGIWCSVRRRANITAIGMCYAMYLFIMVMPIVLDLVWYKMMGPFYVEQVSLMQRAVSYFWTMLLATFNPYLVLFGWTIYLIAAVLLFAYAWLFLYWAGASLRRRSRGI